MPIKLHEKGINNKVFAVALDKNSLSECNNWIQIRFCGAQFTGFS